PFDFDDASTVPSVKGAVFDAVIFVGPPQPMIAGVTPSASANVSVDAKTNPRPCFVMTGMVAHLRDETCATRSADGTLELALPHRRGSPRERSRADGGRALREGALGCFSAE